MSLRVPADEREAMYEQAVTDRMRLRACLALLVNVFDPASHDLSRTARHEQQRIALELAHEVLSDVERLSAATGVRAMHGPQVLR